MDINFHKSISISYYWKRPSMTLLNYSWATTQQRNIMRRYPRYKRKVTISVNNHDGDDKSRTEANDNNYYNYNIDKTALLT